jgi:hypothetical protein
MTAPLLVDAKKAAGLIWVATDSQFPFASNSKDTVA